MAPDIISHEDRPNAFSVDVEILPASLSSSRVHVEHAFDDVGEMLEFVAPDGAGPADRVVAGVNRRSPSSCRFELEAIKSKWESTGEAFEIFRTGDRCRYMTEVV